LPRRSGSLLATELQGEEAPPAEAEAGAQAGRPDGVFSWRKAWYPLAVVADMDITRPMRLELLGENLVAWKDAKGAWCVFEDRCPHRNAPLSEGRVEDDGTLLCSYHGWRFDGLGRVAAIPQVSAAEFPRLREHPRACAAVRPCQVRHGLLWVWGKSSENAALESALVEPAVVQELEDPAMEGRASDFIWQHRDLPYGWEVAIENVVDASHVAVTHHNMISNRYTDPAPIEVSWLRMLTPTDGFKFRMKSLRPKIGMENNISTTDFRPPCQVHNRATSPSGASTTLLLYFSPTKPGRCRMLVSFLVVRGENGEDAPKAMPNASSAGVELRQAAFAFLQSPLFPRWFVHVVAPLFLHQDLVFLHRQQAILQRLEEARGLDWRRACWTPAATDSGSAALRRWLRSVGGVAWSPGSRPDVLPVLDKQLLFDTYKSHTEQCTQCQQALRFFSSAERALSTFAVAALAAALAPLVAAATEPASTPALVAAAPALAAAVACGVAGEACGRVAVLFREVTYDAQDNK